jgi:hypothetical protein
MAATTFPFNKNGLTYLTDETGKKTGVVIPIELWQEITKTIELASLKQKLKKAFEEVAAIERGEIPVVTLREFLEEE